MNGFHDLFPFCFFQGLWSNETISRTETFPPFTSLMSGVMDDGITVFNPCLTSIPVSVVEPQTTLTSNNSFANSPDISFALIVPDALLGTVITGSSFPGVSDFQKTYLDAHLRLDDLQIRPSDLDLDFDRALLAVGCGINLHQSCINCLSGYDLIQQLPANRYPPSQYQPH